MSRSAARWPWLGAALVALAGAGCAAVPPLPPIGRLWQARCGSCHIPVEPGTHSPAVLTAALERHRARVRLTPGEWSELEAWLAPRKAPP